MPELEDGTWTVVTAGPYRWECDAARQVENFTDFGHFPWVHPGLLGDPDRPVVPRYDVRTEGHVLHYSIVRPEAPNSDDFPVFGNEQAGPPERRSTYELHLPYTIALRLGWGGERAMVYFFASQPIAADRCAGYVLIGRNYNLDQPADVIRQFEDTIFGQDQRVVESQRPERVPFDLAAELHLKFDAVAVAYRKAMRSLGLAASDAPGLQRSGPGLQRSGPGLQRSGCAGRSAVRQSHAAVAGALEAAGDQHADGHGMLGLCDAPPDARPRSWSSRPRPGWSSRCVPGCSAGLQQASLPRPPGSLPPMPQLPSPSRGSTPCCRMEARTRTRTRPRQGGRATTRGRPGSGGQGGRWVRLAGFRPRLVC